MPSTTQVLVMDNVVPMNEPLNDPMGLHRFKVDLGTVSKSVKEFYSHQNELIDSFLHPFDGDDDREETEQLEVSNRDVYLSTNLPCTEVLQPTCYCFPFN